MEPTSTPATQVSATRRQVLRIAALSAGALAVAATPVPAFASAKSPSTPDVPDFPEDSAFRPREDQLQAMRERSQAGR